MTTNPLDAIQARADAATEALKAYDRGGSELRAVSRLTDSAADVPKLIAALRAVEAMCGAPEHHETQGPHNGYVTLDNLLGAINEALG